jgi:ketosteroid isomerase-like protein
MENDSELIRKLVEDWAQAIRDGNMDGILKDHSNDVLMFDVPVPLQNAGLEAYKKTWDIFFQYNEGGEGSFELVDLKTTASDTVAFCHALLRIGSPDPECRLTIGLQKIAGKWIIVHEHHSAPFNLPDKEF